MVEKKKVEKELEKIRNDRKTRYNVTVRYRDGGTDGFYGLKSVRVVDGTLELIESTSTTVHLILDVISHFRIVKVE